MQRFPISQNSFIDQPCDRCGGKQRMGKSWKETVPIFTTSAVIEYSQRECVNKECQELFMKKLQDELEKREQQQLLMMKNKKPAVNMAEAIHEEESKEESKNTKNSKSKKK